ncbi:hypothetical protein D9611_008744 [Ephemerocybe angulata]|uniref:Uncharacterized protein n=1 Tax=Ephemerocybe angulata TaxID=980116 RepID=A0A8H5FIZ3_9AGAR|nr:hypothetical protein D9611_008744 [Tulosesus angulatus]
MAPKTLDSSSPNGTRVLSLDGGGFRGLGMLLVLKEITKQANLRNREPSDPQLKPCDIFDIVVGSSTGGLVAVLVGRLGLDCDTAIEEYKALARALFGTDRAEWLKNLHANKKFDATIIARYDKAVDDLIQKYPAASPTTFFTEPPTNAKTGVVVLPFGKPITQNVASFKTAKDPAGNTWTTKDVIRATTAAARYLPQYTPTGETKAYTDAAYAGKNMNPTVLCKDYWGSDLGVLVNIGQWFPEVPLPAKAANLLTKADTKPFKTDFLNGVPEDPKTEETILVYIKQAKMAQDALQTAQSEASLQPAFTRFDPPLGPASRILELVDIFIEDDIKKEVQKWILDNAALFTDVATKLVKPDVTTPEVNTGVHPYNPALNAKKPREMLAYLNTYHVIFVIDDSTSMIMTDNYSAWNDGRWRQAEQSLGPIADFTFKQNVTSVDIGFMHYQRTSPFRGVQNQQKVLQIFKQAKPPQDLNRVQRTPTGATLKFFIDEALKELNSKVNDPDAYKKIAPTDIIMLTDGEADDDPKAVIAAARQQMDANKHNPNYIGIQIVQIGHSPLVKVKLEDMTKGEYGDMADLVPSDGTDLTPEKLTRIMLGGNHPSVRRKLKAEDLQ